MDMWKMHVQYDKILNHLSRNKGMYLDGNVKDEEI